MDQPTIYVNTIQNGCESMLKVNNWANDSKQYAQFKISGTAYLAFKNIPSLISRFASGEKTLDYGCGTGRSSRFLKQCGLDVDGVDTSSDMIKQAQALDNSIPYELIQSGQLSRKPCSYDLVCSSLVLFKVSSMQELTIIFNEIYRVLKENGIFILTTASEHMYQNQWLSLDANYKQNKHLKSGSIAKITLKDIKLTVLDYYWTHHDYLEVAKTASFQYLLKDEPLADGSEGYEWKDELYKSPYATYIFKKNISHIFDIS